MRKGEILNLEWDNINFEYGFIDLLKTKTNRPRRIPLSKELKELFYKMERALFFLDSHVYDLVSRFCV